jgi:hypothetical protein
MLRKTIELACDSDGCTTTYACDANLPASVARADAYRTGWRHTNGKDACPQHAGGKKAQEPAKPTTSTTKK